jgi:hypothetical protein
MSQATTAQELFEDLQALPATERGKFFLLLESRAFQDDHFTHEEVFGHLAGRLFTVAGSRRVSGDVGAELPALRAARPDRARANRGAQPDVRTRPI